MNSTDKSIEIQKDKTVIRLEAKIDCLDKLNKFGRCALLRPTGFGKTWMVSELTTEYDNVLYLYPSKVIKNTAKQRIDDFYDDTEELERYELGSNTESFRNVTFISYLKLVNLYKQDRLSELDNYGLIIMDEVHRIGAEKTYEAVKTLCENFKGHILGVTATPDRMDAEDVITDFFYGITTKEYTLHNAFQDGFIKKPYYCFCSYDVEKDIKHMAKETCLEDSINANELRVDKILKSRIIEISRLHSMDKIIANTVKEVSEKEMELNHLFETDYMKFIVFFDGFKAVNEKGKDVVKWFSKAFPSYEINTLEITSENEITRANVDKLEELEKNKHSNKIDLIMCVNMLNEGYHVDSLTGILMYRGTSSSIIFNQQFGRALSSGEGQPCIVFDIVDNIHRKNVYNLNTKNNRSVQKKLTKTDTLDGFINLDTTNLSDSEKKQLRKILKDISSKDITDIDADYVDKALIILNKTEDFKAISTEDKLVALMSLYKLASRNSDKQWWRLVNKIVPEDLHPTSDYATYEEMLIKAVAEPLTQRCKRAGDKYFMRWCKMNNTNIMPKTKEELLNNGELQPLAEAYALSWKVKTEQMLDAILQFGEEYMVELYKQVHENNRIINRHEA